ncbi:MAG: GIY-YIG nuclease family protein [Patescibacteria group bacterium]
MPEKSGVYIFKNARREILYIGKATNLRRRVKSYFVSQSFFGPKISKIDHILAESEFEALLLEAALIKKHQPKYNTRLKDDKSPLYIKITQEPFPRVYPARKTEGGYGPYPQAKTVRTVLKLLRRIFPYRSCRKLPKKPCLYFDLKLCPGTCVNQSEEDRKTYKKTISQLKNLLERKSNKVVNNLKKDMEMAAKLEDFLKAKELRDKIQKIEWLIQKRHLADEYLENPFLLQNIRQEEVSELRRLLEMEHLSRIEGFDISNISGTKGTGGMVVFVDGEADKSQYRRFRIKTKGTPDDVAMIKEMILRRFKHPEWEFPDLILIDGGKGQISGAIDVLNQLGLKIPVVGLAKKLEILIAPNIKYQISNIKYSEIRLPEDSPALNLLKRIRDESHRFARAYHLKLRKFV